MKLEFIDATTLPDAWFQCVYRILDVGHKYIIDRGSYEGQQRLEFDYITVHIKHPGVKPLLPEIPIQLGIPNPVEEGYLEEYLPYLMTSIKQPNEEYCYSYDTEILTSQGWKFFSDLNGEELVATLNPFSGNVEYQRPIGYNKFEYNGDIYKLNNRRIDFCVNPGHKLFVGVGDSYYKCRNSRFKLLPIDDIINYKFLKFKRDCLWNGNDKEYFELPSVKYNNYRYNGHGSVVKIRMTDWLWFFGIWLAEGDLGRQKNKYSYQVRLSISNKDDRKLVKLWCEKLGFGILEYRRWLIISNKQLYVYLNQFGKAHDKFIPSYIKNLNSDYLNILFKSMMFGDGDRRGYRYTTVSEKLADDFSEICFKIGKSAIKKFDNSVSRSGFKNNGAYRIYIADRYNEPVIENNIIIDNYDGYLYGVEVPNYHVIYVRRNGKAHWSGNTYGERLEYQIQQVIDMYKNDGYNTNQACMSVSMPSDINLSDPPCLRLIDTRIRDGKLNFVVYFRSWDLWGGFPANLGGIQLLKEYMAGEIGVEDGEIIASSKGLHLYDYTWELAKLRTYK